jgi:uncharacterized protein (DUF2141 family)
MKGNEMLSRIKLFAALSLLCCALLISSTGQLSAQVPAAPAQSASTLTVRVTGIRNTNGKIRLSLYRDSKFVEGREVEIDAKTLSANTVFANLSQGFYAVNLFHDENMNGKMDTNLFGMPVEGYGFSNNPHKRMGKPGFDETNFQVNQPEAAIEIKMIYW